MKLWIRTHDIKISDQEIIESIKNDSEFDINSALYYNNCSILMNAVIWNRTKLVEYLLKDPNINVNHKNTYNETALHLSNGYFLKLLLSRKDIDVNIQNWNGWTILHIVCEQRDVECVKELLLDARINIHICDKKRKTALNYVLCWRNISNRYVSIAKIIRKSRYTPLLRIQNSLLLYDIVRMIIDEYLTYVNTKK